MPDGAHLFVWCFFHVGEVGPREEDVIEHVLQAETQVAGRQLGTGVGAHAVATGLPAVAGGAGIVLAEPEHVQIGGGEAEPRAHEGGEWAVGGVHPHRPVTARVRFSYSAAPLPVSSASP